MMSTNSPQVEEGDSRFLASEVLHEVSVKYVMKSVFFGVFYRSNYIKVNFSKC